MALGLLAVHKVHTLGLGLTVDKGTDETGDNLLGLRVVIDLACRCKV